MLRIDALSTALLRVPALAVARGECVAVMGPSGAGKSLLLRAIADLDANDGTLTLHGRSRAAMPAPLWRRLVALVPAESGWWADRVGTHFDGGRPPADLLAALGLPADAGDWSVSRLSSGERHRLAIARALCLKPQVLMLDEPTASLDAASAACVERLVRRLQAEGMGVLLVTHDSAQAERLAARVMRMAGGRLIPTQEAA